MLLVRKSAHWSSRLLVSRAFVSGYGDLPLPTPLKGGILSL